MLHWILVVAGVWVGLGVAITAVLSYVIHATKQNDPGGDAS